VAHKSNGFIALLLIIAIITITFGSSVEKTLITESPQNICGDSVSQTGNIEDSNILAVTAFVIIVIIIIFFIYYICGY